MTIAELMRTERIGYLEAKRRVETSEQMAVGSTDLISDRKALYDELLQLLCKSELAARNGEWMTCGTWAKNVMNRAYEIGNAEKKRSSAIAKGEPR